MRAAVILEVLAGKLLPSDAAAAVGVSTARYYMLESYAMAGLVKACEPRSVGYKRTPERELASLKQAYDKLEQECARYKALVRAMHRSVGLSSGKKDTAKGPGKGRRRIKPTVRALRHARELKAAVGSDSSGEKSTDGPKSEPESTKTEAS
jgi:hypothetical protein